MDSAHHFEPKRDASAESARNPAPEPAPSRTAAVLHARTQKRHRARGWVLLIAALVVIGGISAWWALRGSTPVSYLTQPAARGNIVQTITASGSVNPVVTVQVGTYVSGVIQSLACDYNTQVKKGQICAEIDPRPYQTIVDQDQANLATAKAQLAKDQTNLDYTKLTYTRNQDLAGRGIVSQDTLDAAKSAYSQAQAQVQVDRADVQQRQAVLDAATVNLSYTKITSPVDGTVISRNVNVGQTVAASFQTPTLFVIATDLTKMQVDANVSESDIGRVQSGDQASFTVEAFPDHPFTGQVTQVRRAPQTVQNVVTYDVVIDVSNPELMLRPGMTANTRIVVAHRDNVVKVPDQALRFTPGGLTGSGARPAGNTGGGARPGGRAARTAPGAARPPAAQGSMPGQTAPAASAEAGTPGQVWVLRNGQPVPVPVRVGLTTDTEAEILQGLQPGDQVIVGERTGAAGANGAQTGSRLRLRL